MPSSTSPKETIERRQAWQSYIETHFNVQRRVADWHVGQTQSWTELVAAHEEFVAKYNYQAHCAHFTGRHRWGGGYTARAIVAESQPIHHPRNTKV